MSETILEVKHLGKAFGSHDVLRDIDFSVKSERCYMHYRSFRIW